MNVTLKIDCVHVHILDSQELREIITRLTTIERKVDNIAMTDLEVSALLDKVNDTTNAIAANQTADSTTLGKVKTELEALIAQPPSQSGLSDATSAKLQSFAATLGQLKTNADNNTTVLNAIAAEGEPVVPPPPPPPPVV